MGRAAHSAKRRHRAVVYEHLGTQDPDGWPSDRAGEFSTLISGLPCSLESLTGNDAVHSHNLHVEYHSGVAIKPQYRIVIDNCTYEVLSVDDTAGTRRDLFIKMRKIDEPTPFHSDHGT